MGPCYDPDDDAGAGGGGGGNQPGGDVEWPEDRGPAYLQGGGNVPNPPGGRTPPAAGDRPGVNGAPPPTPSGRQTPANPPAGDQPPAAGVAITQQQYDELRARNEELERQFRESQSHSVYMRRVLSAALGRDIPGPAQPPTEEERRNGAIRERLLQVFPELKQITDLAKARETDEAERNRQADAHAKRHINGALNHVAEQMLGAGKTMKDLSPRQQRWMQDAFISWVEADEQRIADYEAGTVDYKAFWSDYHREMRADSARATAAVIEDRAGRVAALPSGGPSSAPVGTPPPDLNMLDEDAVHKAAWRNATQGRTVAR